MGSCTWATDQRYSVPNDVAPGQSATLTVTITALSTGGSYVLEYQMVQEYIAWFPEYQESALTVGSASPSPSGTTYFTRTPDGQLLSERTPSGTYYYLFDGTGSVVGLTNSSGSLVNSYAYDPYGNATSVSEQIYNPFRYAGAAWDPATGLYTMGERYYDPSSGRFTQQDPAGGGYAYCGDDPVNYSDPSGAVRWPINKRLPLRFSIKRSGVTMWFTDAELTMMAYAVGGAAPAGALVAFFVAANPLVGLLIGALSYVAGGVNRQE